MGGGGFANTPIRESPPETLLLQRERAHALPESAESAPVPAIRSLPPLSNHRLEVTGTSQGQGISIPATATTREPHWATLSGGGCDPPPGSLAGCHQPGQGSVGGDTGGCQQQLQGQRASPRPPRSALPGPRWPLDFLKEPSFLEMPKAPLAPSSCPGIALPGRDHLPCLAAAPVPLAGCLLCSSCRVGSRPAHPPPPSRLKTGLGHPARPPNPQQPTATIASQVLSPPGDTFWHSPVCSAGLPFLVCTGGR